MLIVLIEVCLILVDDVVCCVLCEVIDDCELWLVCVFFLVKLEELCNCY